MSLLIVNIGQLVTPQGTSARRGADQGRLQVIEDAYVQVVHGRITAVGRMEELPKADGPRLDARRGLVLPGLVDAHTHAAFVGTREEEFLRRCRGEPYGKGILTTVARVRRASEGEIFKASSRFLGEMLRAGTTTVEVKSGYGLDTENELKLLRVIRALQRQGPQEIVPTFLGAHAVPEGRTVQDYLGELIGRMIPRVKAESLAEFCDVFCEEGFFDLEASRQLLQAAKGAGFALKLHADELRPGGGAELAARLGAVSADHLLKVSARGVEVMAQAGVIAVLLPGTAFTLDRPYAPARELIAAGVPVALATDFNPGTCLIHSMTTVLSLAVMKMGMTVEEALCAATLNAACALRRGQVCGSLEPGKRADLVIFDLENYGQLPYFFGHNRVRAVVCHGRTVYQNPGLR